MGWYLPVGLDFADGVTPLPEQPKDAGGTPTVVGTPLPTANIQIWANSINGVFTVEEPPGSPHLERAEQCTCSHTLRMSWVEARYYWTLMPRGTIVQDAEANVWRVLSCDIKRMEATSAELSYVMESISFDTPPDDFQLNEVSLDLNIIKHPRYAWALNPYITDASTYALVGETRVYYTQFKEALIRMIQNYTDSPFYPSQSQVQGMIQSNILSMIDTTSGPTSGKIQVNYNNPNYDGSKTTVAPVPWDGTTANLPSANCPYFVISAPVNLANPSDPITIAIAAAKELLTKLWRSEDTPYIAAFEVVWTQYFFAPVYLNPGAYVEDVRDFVPQYFISPVNNGTIPRGIDAGGFPADTSPAPGADGNTIFDYLTSYNPQCYAVDGKNGGPLAISCLRKSDHYDYERTWFRVAHQWLVAPIGKWDSDIYSQKDRPQYATDYNQLPNQFGQ